MSEQPIAVNPSPFADNARGGRPIRKSRVAELESRLEQAERERDEAERAAGIYEAHWVEATERLAQAVQALRAAEEDYPRGSNPAKVV